MKLACKQIRWILTHHTKRSKVSRAFKQYGDYETAVSPAFHADDIDQFKAEWHRFKFDLVDMKGVCPIWQSILENNVNITRIHRRSTFDGSISDL